jgi:hypothetical protein
MGQSGMRFERHSVRPRQLGFSMPSPHPNVGVKHDHRTISHSACATGVMLLLSFVERSLALTLFGNLSLARNLNHAEEVAVGIFQHDKIIIRAISPGIASRPDLD